MSESKTTGGCTCGAIRYEFSGQPAIVFNCHCHACQKATGNAFVSGAVVPDANFKFTSGEPVYHTSQGDSGRNINRGFCARCGTHVATTLDKRPGIIAMTLGSLDNPAAFKPQMNFYTAHALPWVVIGDDTKNFPGEMTR